LQPDNKKNILFVDDEQNVLQGLQRMLYGMRSEWNMAFASNGFDALEMLEKEHFHVIVSDMRMPQMDGIKLLTEVKNRFPDVMRIILSGQSKQESLLPSMGLAHQYLSKPCSCDQLKQTVARVCSLRDMLTSPTLQALVAKVGTLPTLPSIHAELVAELRSEACSLEKIGDIVSQDVGLTAKLLQLVNSSFFGLPNRVSDASQAVLFLGIETVTALILSYNTFSNYEGKMPANLSLGKLWRHSFNTGFLAKEIARYERGDNRLMNDSCTAGLLHDIGKMILASAMPDKFGLAVKLAGEHGQTEADAERALLGASHAEVGAYLLGLWGLPDPIVEAVAFHHRPKDCITEGFGPLTAVYAANLIEQNLLNLESPPDEYLVSLGLQDRVGVWMDTHEDMASRNTELSKKSA
jgi:putative nucleotidyltransferase with HDIG domain